MDSNLYSQISRFAHQMRRDALEMAYSAGDKASHFGAGMSIIEIVATLYAGTMKLDPCDPTWEGRDRFILSKGHGVLGYYPALKQIGYISGEELLTFEKSGSFLAGHPIMNRAKGIEFSNGSLGMGLSIANGLALSFKRRQMNNQVYVLLGDGECNEGANWEAFMSASHYHLDNLTCIVDYNNLQLGGSNDFIMSINNIKLKGESFGWNVIEVDGHRIEEIYNALQFTFDNQKPKLIVAHTIKGHGFTFSNNNNDWHHAVMTKKVYEEALLELEGNNDY